MKNPYSPPATDDLAAVHASHSAGDARKFVIATALIVCANSLVPLFFASLVTNAAARYGMVAGLVLTLVASIGLGVQVPRLRPALRKGGVVLALTQFFPLIQLFVGMLAMACCIELGLADTYNDDHPAGCLTSATAGFACTVITATVFSSLVVLVGFPLSRRGQT